ncbi:hypothetical protein B0H11DRAFT_1862437 [Mycena galericulata]|nr:hypothetical protein B0H11DRAFT_1862437 [Mycena galericulata]
MPSQHTGGRKFWGSKLSSKSQSDWLATSITAAQAMTAGAQCLPFPYVQGVFGTVVVLLQTVEKVKKNRGDLEDLCGTILEIIRCIQDQLSARGNTGAVRVKGLCEDLERVLQEVLQSVKQLQVRPKGLSGRFKEVVNLSSTAGEISGYRTKLQELRLNFLLMAAIDTNMQVHHLSAASINAPQLINTCPSPSRIFHGRQLILDMMHQFFSQDLGKQHIFLLHGLGGAGKTQIGLKFVEQFTSHFTDIFLIDTTTVQTIETDLKNVATRKNIGDSSKDALQWLKSKPSEWLLFFDNADDPKINLNDYFPQCNHGNILITSRNPALAVYASSHCTVSNMEETDAVSLLLKSAAQENTDHNNGTAAQIVKVLHYLPLAIVQAGGFISRSGNLEGYLALYAHSRARLLNERPTQSHDNYAWPVYTTWQMSFDRLSEQAKIFLKLCSFLHHHGISEDIFKNATNYRISPYGPEKHELDMTLNILSYFLGSSGVWDPLCFVDITNEIRAYSLINFDFGQNVFSIHPLVHDWTRTLADGEYHQCMVAIAGMSVTGLSDNDVELISRRMLPHMEVLMGNNSTVRPDFRHEYAQVYLFGGKPKRAEELQLSVLRDRRSLLGDEHPDTLTVMQWLARTYTELGKFKAAEELWTVVFMKREDILGKNHPDTLESMGDLGMVYTKLGKLHKAQELLVPTLEKRRDILGVDHINTLKAMTEVARVYYCLGPLERAEELQVVVYERHKECLGGNHPTTLTAMGGLAATYTQMGRLPEAEALQRTVFEKSRTILGSNHPQTLTAMGNLAMTYQKLGQQHEALELQRVVLEHRENTQGRNHPSTLRAMLNLASTLNKLGEWQEAERFEVTVLEQRRTILGNNHPGTLHVMARLGSTLNNLQRWQEAEELLVAAFEKQKDLLNEKHPHFLETMQSLIVTYTRLGKLKEADDLSATLT